MGIVLAPNRAAKEVSIMRRLEIVVDGRDDGEDPRKQSQDLVSGDGCRAMRLPLREGIDCWKTQLALWTPTTVENDGYRLTFAEVRHVVQAKGK